MSDKQRHKRIEADLQKAGTVIYLEGQTDPEILFALLGLARPRGDVHQDTLVVGLGKGGSGCTEVAGLARVAGENGQAGALSAGGIFGVTDGDGRDLSVLAGEFDAPHVGPVFSWKAYCIENLLAKAAWPGAWGAAPDWADVLGQYAPYAALNRVHRSLQADLETLGLHRFRNPQRGQALETEQTIGEALAQDKGLVAGRDVAADFTAALTHIQGELAATLDAGHAQINGKWLCNHYAPTRAHHGQETCRAQWAAAVREAGGLAEVRNWWKRVTGKAP